MGWRGFNCTIPHKIAVIEYLDELSPAGQAIGAVNCVSIRKDMLIGDNTDGKGFLQSVSSLRAVSGMRVAILGAGGAARAIAVELALAGDKDQTIVNRTPARAREVADAVRRAKTLPGLRVGLHLVVIEGPAALPPQRISLLCESDGVRIQLDECVDSERAGAALVELLDTLDVGTGELLGGQGSGGHLGLELGHGRFDQILNRLRAGRIADDRHDAAPCSSREGLRRLLEHAAIPRADGHVDAFAR